MSSELERVTDQQLIRELLYGPEPVFPKRKVTVHLANVQKGQFETEEVEEND